MRAIAIYLLYSKWYTDGIEDVGEDDGCVVYGGNDGVGPNMSYRLLLLLHRSTKSTSIRRNSEN